VKTVADRYKLAAYLNGGTLRGPLVEKSDKLSECTNNIDDLE